MAQSFSDRLYTVTKRAQKSKHIIECLEQDLLEAGKQGKTNVKILVKEELSDTVIEYFLAQGIEIYSLDEMLPDVGYEYDFRWEKMMEEKDREVRGCGSYRNLC